MTEFDSASPAIHVKPRDPQFPSVELRQFVPEDLDASGLFPPGPSQMPPEQIANDFADEKSSSDLLKNPCGCKTWSRWGIYSQDRIVGFTNIFDWPQEFERPEEIELFSGIYVLDPAVRRQRIGSHAVLGVVQYAFKELKADSHSVHIATWNKASIRTHARLGFMATGPLVINPETGEELTFMQLLNRASPCFSTDAWNKYWKMTEIDSAGFTGSPDWALGQRRYREALAQVDISIQPVE